ncbi:histidine phosphatase family protein [Acetobacter persici]|uniref:histidine phosphatase family protein n=1 Tax=Acetobacter persici TaxID=1076596 RepID=UPI0020CF7952|nr:histidine phosphatase family protein [Acetobacter persici]MCP9318985.1 histidine phosphatase family protein [Acetobacter persici]
MTRASTPQTLRLICLTTSLPDAVKQGCIPAREARGLVTLPKNAVGFSLPHLRKPPQFSQIILAEDCVCTSAINQADPLTHPLTGPEGAPPSVRSGNASFRPAGGPSSLQTREAQEAPGVSHETSITHTAALTDRDYGTWHGQALKNFAPEGLHALLHDPDFAPPEGESLRQLHARVETWLTTLPQEEAARGTIPAAARATGSGAQTLLIIARPSVVRALACAILGGGPEMAAKLDIPPQTTSLFTHHVGHWRVRALGAGQETGRKSQG